jgi:hypothetical protein
MAWLVGQYSTGYYHRFSLGASGRPRKVWLMELRYSSDTRYMYKVMEKKEQHAELCKLLAAEGYDVMLIVLGNAGTLFKCLHRATKEMEHPQR